jgi:hypothetical protein
VLQVALRIVDLAREPRSSIRPAYLPWRPLVRRERRPATALADAPREQPHLDQQKDRRDDGSRRRPRRPRSRAHDGREEEHDPGGHRAEAGEREDDGGGQADAGRLHDPAGFRDPQLHEPDLADDPGDVRADALDQRADRLLLTR